jgi:tetratricopeptide (TPR) repeat protein
MERALTLDPENPLVYFTLGETQAILRRYDAAGKSFERSGELSSDPVAAYANRANAALLAGDVSGARLWLERSAAPGSHASGEIRVVRFAVACGLGDYERALRLADEMPEADSAQFDFECRAAARGLALEGKGTRERPAPNSSGALAVLDRYARDHVDASNFRSLRGLVLASLGRSDEALADGKLALTLRPASGDAWIHQYRLFDLALIEIATGRHDDAVAHLGELLAQPSDQYRWNSCGKCRVFDPLRGNPGFVKLVAP